MDSGVAANNKQYPRFVIPHLLLINYPWKHSIINKRWSLWVGWCVSSWRPWFWPVHSIYYIHTTHYNRILTINLILCGFRCAFSCMFQYSLCYGMDIGTCDIVHWSAAPHDCIANWTGFWVCVVLVLNVIRYSGHYFLDRILFHYDFHYDCCGYHWDFYGHLLPFDPHFWLPLHK